MGQRHARILQSLRPRLLDRLIEVRGSIDDGYGLLPEDLMRQQFGLILDKMHTFLATEDASGYRGFASRYVAMCVAEGFTHESLIHSVVAIGDVIAQEARKAIDNTAERQDFVRLVMHMNFEHVRMLVTFVAGDLAERMAQRDMLIRSMR